MATTLLSSVYNFTVEADWQVAANALYNLLIAGGWTAVDSTAAPSGTTKPTGGLQRRWEGAFTMGDSLNATLAAYLYQSAGSNTSGAANPRMSARVGFSTNGSKIINSSSLTAEALSGGNNSNAAGPFKIVGSAGNNRVTLAFWPDKSTTSAFLIHVERTKNASGADTATGLIVTLVDTFTAANTWLCYYLVPGGTFPPALTRLVAAAPVNDAVGTFGLDVGISRVFPWQAGVQNPCRDLLLVPASDLAVDSVVTLTVDGASRTYRALDNLWAPHASTQQRLLIRYE